MGFSHTSHTATHVLQHKCDQWASADAGIVRQDSPRASRPQAILKFRPPSSLDYKARHGPQTILWCMQACADPYVILKNFTNLEFEISS